MTELVAVLVSLISTLIGLIASILSYLHVKKNTNIKTKEKNLELIIEQIDQIDQLAKTAKALALIYSSVRMDTEIRESTPQQNPDAGQEQDPDAGKGATTQESTTHDIREDKE